MKKTLICLRGAPGSGKTTLAKELQKGFTKNEGATAHWEADMYFTSEDGTYKFDPKLLPVAHEWCRNKVRDSLKNCPLVIVSNTSIRRSDVEAYKEIAKEAGAEFKVFLVVGNFQNVHKVLDEKVREMRRKYEEYPGEGKYYRGGGK